MVLDFWNMVWLVVAASDETLVGQQGICEILNAPVVLAEQEEPDEIVSEL